MIRKYEKKDIDEIVNLENKVLGETLGAEMFNKSLYLSMAHYYVYEENQIFNLLVFKNHLFHKPQKRLELSSYILGGCYIFHYATAAYAYR